ncbi:MAG: hypothetical protein IT437_00065 [Phycisphaerales bacterium]|nr:hypothetical protein [Phycisphaerales bacterium]
MNIAARALFVLGMGAPALAQCQPGWEAVPGAALNKGVEALLAVPGGAGDDLYVGGSFTSTGIEALRIAKFDGVNWSPLGEGIPEFTHGLFGCCAKVHALSWYDDGTGAALFVGGDFILAGQLAVESIAKWQGDQWHTVGGGLVGVQPCSECPPRVYSMTIFNSGTGPRLYLGGNFGGAGPLTVNHAASWDGLAWAGLDGGVNSTQPGQPTPPWIQRMDVFDGGLYATGQFTVAGGTNADSIARWNGSAWQDVGGLGPNGPKGPFAYGNATAVFDDGTGAALYVAGEFQTAGGVPARNIARYDGVSWSDVGGGVNAQVRCLRVFDDGTGPALYAGGDFDEAGGAAAASIARWDGHTWSAVGPGLESSAYVMEVARHAGTAYLYVGGWFQSAGGLPAPYLARYASCAPACYPDCNGDGARNLSDFGCFQTKFALGDPYADCNGDGARNLADFGCFTTKFALGCP